MPPLESSSIISKPVFMRGFTIPCQDDIECRELVSKLAGREAAVKRKELMHNRHHDSSPTMDISVWLPDEDVGLSGDALSQIVESKYSVKCSAQKLEQESPRPRLYCFIMRIQMFKLNLLRLDLIAFATHKY